MSSRYKTGDIVRITYALAWTPEYTSGVWVVVQDFQGLPWSNRVVLHRPGGNPAGDLEVRTDHIELASPLDLLVDDNYTRHISQNGGSPL